MNKDEMLRQSLTGAADTLWAAWKSAIELGDETTADVCEAAARATYKRLGQINGSTTDGGSAGGNGSAKGVSKTKSKGGFDFRFDGSALKKTGKGTKGPYTQTVPVTQMEQVIGVASGLKSFTMKEVGKTLKGKGKYVPAYIINATIHFLKEAELAEKSAWGTYDLKPDAGHSLMDALMKLPKP